MYYQYDTPKMVYRSTRKSRQGDNGMKINQDEFNQIATTLAAHYESVFYVEIETGRYTEVVPTQMLTEIHIPAEGEDFFAQSRDNAHKYVHPDDLEKVLRFHDKTTILDNLASNGFCSLVCRIILDGKIVYVRHLDMMCEDKKHVLFCMENIDEEIREKEEQKKNLQSAERLARLDELTGIKNKNAFVEYRRSVNKKIQSADSGLRFGIVMCDVNDMKRFNDTRGHSFGDEMLCRACRMICAIFPNSQVYRIGGDEFVVILLGEDFEIKEELLENLRRESVSNGRSRSGPVIASGMAEYNPSSDAAFSDVFKRADLQMYENKRLLKSGSTSWNNERAMEVEIPIPEERKRRLDGLYGALFTMAGEGYVFLNDLQYDYSRWSMSLIDDFGLQSEYMYHAGKIWQDYVHPDDLPLYKGVIDAVICGRDDMKYLRYRARRPDGMYIVLQPRAFILNDSQGNPEYFGGIIVPVEE